MAYLISFVAILLCANVQAQQVDKVSLLELYSSEGCSSCPPAEKSLYDLVGHKNLWKKFVPINFHVDYWNRLGWVDVYSSKKFTDRQHSYANIWKTNRIYTPAFVMNGVERGSSLPALSEDSMKSNIRIGIEEVSEHLLRIKVASQNNSQFKLHFALLANGLESVVKSGENEGRTLKHNFVVMELIEEPIKEINMFKITKPKVPYKSLSYAVWVSSKTTSEVIQATGGDL